MRSRVFHVEIASSKVWGYVRRGVRFLPRLSRVLRFVWNVQQFRSPALRDLPSAVVSRRGLYARMSRKVLRCGDVCAGVEQIADKGAPHVMWRESGDGGLLGTLPENVQDGLIRQRSQHHPTYLVDVAE